MLPPLLCEQLCSLNPNEVGLYSCRTHFWCSCLVRVVWQVCMKGHVLGTLLCNYIGFIASASQDRLTFSVVWQMTSKGEVRVPQHPSTCTVCSYIYLHSTPCSYYVHCVQLPISTSIGKYFAFQVELTSEVQAVIRGCGIHNRCLEVTCILSSVWSSYVWNISVKLCPVILCN